MFDNDYRFIKSKPPFELIKPPCYPFTIGMTVKYTIQPIGLLFVCHSESGTVCSQQALGFRIT